MSVSSVKMWFGIRSIFEKFASRVTIINPCLLHSLGYTENDAFFLRSCLAFRKHNDGDEVAIKIDATLVGVQLRIVSDICCGDGMVLAEGPSIALNLDDMSAEHMKVFNDWLSNFEQFIHTNESEILDVASKLS